MSMLVRFPASDVTRQQYDAVRDALTDAGQWPPDGCEQHVCFGESQEKFEAFGETLRPRLEEAGIELSGQPEFFDVHLLERF
jgi:hypothetical protein